jgi:flagellar basal-body rod modification protein FlgD
MATIDNFITNTTEQKTIKSYGNKELTQNDFMKLLGAQLQHQDPMKPMENGEFIAEMAQFSQLQNTKDLVSSFKELSSTMISAASLQASVLVGKNVSFQSSTVALADNGANISATNPVSGDVTISFMNSSNEIVHSHSATYAPGKITYNWDGSEGNIGETYSISITNSSMDTNLIPEIQDKVKSVDVSGIDIAIKLANNGQITRNNLIEILEH